MTDDPALTETEKAILSALLAGDTKPATIAAAMEALGKRRIKTIAATAAVPDNDVIATGPFAGMVYPPFAGDTARIARVLGCYAQALDPVIAEIIAQAPPLIMDVGCGSGFFAVGFARHLRRSTVWARDADPAAQDAATALSKANDTQNRVKVGGALTHADFDICRAQHTLVFCHEDAAADGLLDPVKAKGLRRADVLVEINETHAPGLTQTLVDRFTQTHHHQFITRKFTSQSLPDWMHSLSDMDRLLALCEWRGGPTLWLWLQQRTR